VEMFRNFWKIGDLIKITVGYCQKITLLHLVSAVYGNVAGWVDGCLSVTAGIVSKRLNLS